MTILEGLNFDSWEFLLHGMSVLSDLACLLPTQCGKLANFPSFIFYVKSILTDKKGAKNVILTVLEALNFDFVEIA